MQIHFSLLTKPRIRQLVNRQPFTAISGFGPGSKHVRFVVEEIVLKTRFSPSTSVFHNPPMFHTFLSQHCPTQDKQTKSGNFQCYVPFGKGRAVTKVLSNRSLQTIK
jgi:hypothetical protein